MTGEAEDERARSDCRYYYLELREFRGSGPLALTERDWCQHPKHSPCPKERAVWHDSPPTTFRNLTCGGQRGLCPLTPGQFGDVE